MNIVRVRNASLRPGDVLVGGTRIIKVERTYWKKELRIVYQMPDCAPRVGYWSTNGTKVLIKE